MFLSSIFATIFCLLQLVFAAPSIKSENKYFALNITGDNGHSFAASDVDGAFLTLKLDSAYDKSTYGNDWHSIFLKIGSDGKKSEEPDFNFYFSEGSERLLCYARKSKHAAADDPCAVITCAKNTAWGYCMNNLQGMGFANLEKKENRKDKSGNGRRYLEDWQQDNDKYLRPWGIAHYIAEWEDPSVFGNDKPYFLKWYNRLTGVSVSIHRFDRGDRLR